MRHENFLQTEKSKTLFSPQSHGELQGFRESQKLTLTEDAELCKIAKTE